MEIDENKYLYWNLLNTRKKGVAFLSHYIYKFFVVRNCHSKQSMESNREKVTSDS